MVSSSLPTLPVTLPYRYTVKDLLNHEFFADSVRVEVVDDIEDSVQVRLKLEVPGNKELPKHKEAIEFDYNYDNDDPEAVVEEMVRRGARRGGGGNVAIVGRRGFFFVGMVVVT